MLKAYDVTITAKFPAYGETPGVERIWAKDSADAIKKARARMRDAGWTPHDGPNLYRARLAEQEEK